MALGKRILRNATFLTVGDKISNLLLFFFFLYFARKFGVVPTGEYSFGFSFAYSFIVFADVGISTFLVREVAKRNTFDRQLFLDCFIVRSIAILVVTCIAISVIIAFFNEFSKVKILVLIYWGIYWLFFSLADVFIAELNGHEMMGRVSLLGIWHKLICLIGGSTLIFLGIHYSVVLIVLPISSIVYFISCIFVSMASLGWSNARVRRFKGYTLMLKDLMPFYIAFILLEILWSQDILILGVMRGDQSVGIYSSALKITTFILGMSTFIYISILPVLSKLFIESKEKLKYISHILIKYTVLVFLPMSFGIFITADKIIEILYTEGFSESCIVLKILSWVIVAGFTQALFSAILTAIDRQSEKVVWIGVNFTVSVPLNLILIYYFNYSGAAMAKLVTTVLGLLFFANLVYRYLDICPLLKLSVRPLIACLVMMAFRHYFQDIGLSFFIIISALIYMVSLLLLGTFSKEEISFFKEIVPTHFFRENRNNMV